MCKSTIAVIIAGLLIAGMIIHQADRVGIDAALRRAIRKGDLNEVRQCLKNGPDLNSKDRFGYTALIGASYFGHGAIVRLLLKNGADVNAKDENGRTALDYARALGHYRIMMLLKAWGARDEGLRIWVDHVRGV